MSSTVGPQRRQRDGGTSPGAFARPGESLLRIAVPPGTPQEARVAIERLIELTSVLARRSAQLQEALDSRVVIEQAKGVLCERYAIDADQAFQLLRRGARSNRMRIHDLAARIIATRETPPELTVVGLPGLMHQ
jgi:ANTAR domain